MLVNTNLSSLSAQRMLFENTKTAASAMERLATGSKINQAQDDVAGSAIADRMTSQVLGLNMAVKNANDALSMLSVAETAAEDQTNILQRIRELTLQATNDTNSPQDRAYLQSEVSVLVSEVHRLNGETKFNGEAIGGLKNFQLGANAGQSISTFIGLSSGYAGSVFGQATQDYVAGDDFIEIEKLNKRKETKILRLNSLKSIKRLGWKPIWNLKVTLKRVFEWNVLFNKGVQAKNICEKQFLMYLNNK